MAKTTAPQPTTTTLGAPLPATTTHPLPIAPATQATVDDVVAWLRAEGSDANRAGMQRFAIPVAHAFGVSSTPLKAKAKALGRDHDLAQGLWQAGYLETRLLAAFVDEPLRVTTAQMEAWVADVDGWSLCDTLCQHLFRKTLHAWPMARTWVKRDALWAKRAGFAMVATLAVHGDASGAPDDDALREALGWVEAAADDERPFVKKAVNWALRQVGKRNRRLHTAAVAVAERLRGPSGASPSSSSPAARWIASDALRELRSPAVLARLEAKAETKKMTSKAAKKTKTTKKTKTKTKPTKKTKKTNKTKKTKK